MPKKRKLTKSQRREARLRKTRQWALTYEGNRIVRAYRKRFKVDVTCALKDFGEIGVFDPERLAAMKQAEASSFKAAFTHMEISECQWLLHDGQQPDEE